MGLDVINITKNTDVWIKDEHNDNVHLIKAGHNWKKRQDGFSIPAYMPGYVFKTPDLVDVIIGDDRLIVPYIGLPNTVGIIAAAAILIAFNGGWQGIDFVNDNEDWRKLYLIGNTPGINTIQRIPNVGLLKKKKF